MAITREQISTIMDVINHASVFDVPPTEEELLEKHFAFKIVANLCWRALEIHHGYQVEYKKMCADMDLSARVADMDATQDIMEELLPLFWIKLIRKDDWKRGDGMPGFAPITKQEEILPFDNLVDLSE